MAKYLYFLLILVFYWSLTTHYYHHCHYATDDDDVKDADNDEDDDDNDKDDDNDDNDDDDGDNDWRWAKEITYTSTLVVDLSTSVQQKICAGMMMFTGCNINQCNTAVRTSVGGCSDWFFLSNPVLLILNITKELL